MQIKFITLNILEGGVFWDNIVDFFDKESPDIVVLQEVFDGKSEKLPSNLRSLINLKSYFKNFYFHYSPSYLNTAISKIEKVEMGNAIFSRFPILKNNIILYNSPYDKWYAKPFHGKDYSNDPCTLQHAEINVNDTIINVFNNHGVWGFDGEDNARRLKMSEVIVNQIRDKKNIILAGDFNVSPNTETIRNIEKYLTNAFKGELKSTFNMRHKENPGYATSVVDMVFVSPNIKVLEHYRPDVDVSDHYPLVCMFAV